MHAYEWFVKAYRNFHQIDFDREIDEALSIEDLEARKNAIAALEDKVMTKVLKPYQDFMLAEFENEKGLEKEEISGLNKSTANRYLGTIFWTLVRLHAEEVNEETFQTFNSEVMKKYWERTEIIFETIHIKVTELAYKYKMKKLIKIC